MESETRGYSCKECGLTLKAAPPDDFHPYASLTREDLAEPVERNYKCARCKQSTTLYWGREALPQ